MRALDLALCLPPLVIGVRALRRTRATTAVPTTTLPELALTLAVPGAPTRRIRLHRDSTVGSAPSCGIQVGGPGVDRFHATLSVAGGHWVLADAGSRTGLWANEAPVFEPIELRRGDVVRLGSVTCTVDAVSA